MAYKYSRYIGRVTRQPWAILPEKFEVIAALMRERAAGHKPSDEEIAARLGADSEMRRPAPRPDGAVAVIPVHGVVAHRADSFEASSGGTSTELIGRMLQRVVNDDSVKAVLLDFDSPGGSVEGVPELAAQIAKATAVKPIVAHLNAMAASAGYWLASQATEVVVTPSGMAGSIGVFMMLIDESEALAKEGFRVNAISAGDYKLEGAWWEPLSDEARAFYQDQVNAVYRDFLSAVAKGRGVTVAEVKKNYGQGRVFDAKEALARGMVDQIATFDDTLARLIAGKSGRSSRAALAVGARANGSEVPPALAGADATPTVRAEDQACESCGGTGLKPERAMGDPQGQEPCDACAGSGQAQAPVAAASGGNDGEASARQAVADRDLLETTMALIERENDSAA